ncbi:hypothetical protein [Brevundimonas sp.]|uniref:hypothetical protein n=1 Tax=Brevundimonas sp. TaxID=1871086 RepID=UPI0028AF2D0B|nr:hypothetical protein [Brevundimonas sp.]
MPFVISRTSNVGTTHPTVARLMIQTGELVAAANMTSTEKDEINTIYFKELQPVLLECWNIRDSISAEVTDCLTNCEIDAKDNRVIRMRSVNQLEQRAENFLYQAKNYLRNTLRVWNWFYGADFADASAYILNGKETQSKLEAWALKEFGPDDRRTLLIQSEQQWAVPLIRMRNALEHPGGFSGTVYMENITVTGQRFMVPTWRRNDEPAWPMVAAMSHFLDDMLAMGEDILAVNIEPRLHPVSMIYEVPEAERDPMQPCRLRVGLQPEFLAKMTENKPTTD